VADALARKWVIDPFAREAEGTKGIFLYQFKNHFTMPVASLKTYRVPLRLEEEAMVKDLQRRGIDGIEMIQPEIYCLFTTTRTANQ
jgi:hypothetical protein